MSESENALHNLRFGEDFVSVVEFLLKLSDSGTVSVQDGREGRNGNQAAH